MLRAEHRAVQRSGQKSVHGAECFYRGGLPVGGGGVQGLERIARHSEREGVTTQLEGLGDPGGLVGLVAAVEQLCSEAGRVFGVGLLLVEFGAVGGELRDPTLQGLSSAKLLVSTASESRRSISAASASSWARWALIWRRDSLCD